VCTEIKNEHFKKIGLYADLYAKQILARRIFFIFLHNFRLKNGWKISLIFRSTMGYPRTPLPLLVKKQRWIFWPQKVLLSLIF